MSFSGEGTSSPHRVNSNAPPNSLKDSNASPKVKTMEEEGVGVHSLTCNTSRVRGVCWSFRMGTRTNSQEKVQDETNLHNQERRRLVQVEWKWCDKFSRDSSSISFTWPATFGRRHHSPPYSILCASLQGLRPNVTFPRNSQMEVPKLELFLSQNFGHSYFSQIKSIVKMKGNI